jgi:hypothetical protein
MPAGAGSLVSILSVGTEVGFGLVGIGLGRRMGFSFQFALGG